MILSEIVAYLNLLDSLETEHECNEAVGKLKHINHVITERADPYQPVSQNINQIFNDLSKNISRFAKQVDDLKQNLRQEIVQREQEYLTRSFHIYREESRHDSADTVLNRRMRIDGNDDIRLRTHLKNLTDWRMPGMIIRPGLETYIEDMVPLDPLYVVDHDSKLIQPAVGKFTPEYQRRLREYVINDWADGPILDQLPDNQFGAIFAYNYFNHKPMPVICKFLDEFYKKLRPGGSVIMTYNNCDRWQGVVRAENAWMMYTPRRLIEQHAASQGFELIDAYDGLGEVSWLELRKPGNLSSIRGGQTLAKIIAKAV